MAINTSRQEARLKASREMLAKDPTNTALAGRVNNQELALADAERAYPKLLMSHLKKCANNGQVDPKGRTKKQAKDLLAGIPIPKKAGTGNG